MKILIRDKTTLQYIKQTGVYTSVFAEAVDFFCQELAREFCDKHKLKEHEILAADEGW